MQSAGVCGEEASIGLWLINVLRRNVAANQYRNLFNKWPVENY